MKETRYCILRPVAAMLMSIVASFAMLTTTVAQAPRPNIIVILTDDMGYGDIGSLYGKYSTPNIDRLAAGGRIFTRYYSASPICSPSRVGLLTGMHPAKWNITSYLQKKAGNRLCEQADFLRPDAPTTARFLKNTGYATAHFGKWHMGGGRDVEDAPSIEEYGFDTWSSTYESPDPDPLLTATDWIWSDADSIKRWNRTKYWVDKTVAFLRSHTGQPCYINLWPDDVHTPWVPGDDERGRHPGEPESEKSFAEVLKIYDRAIGHLLDELKSNRLDSNTMVVFTSDNGPLPSFGQQRSAGWRGTKLSLYEGGIRMPFIVHWPAQLQAGSIDSVSILSATDLLPSFCRLAGAEIPDFYKGDGKDMSGVLLGTPNRQEREIYWEYGRNDSSFNYPRTPNRSPSLAVREGKWKFLMNADGSNKELYDIEKDPNERSNLVKDRTRVASRLSRKLLSWWRQLPAFAAKE